MIKFGIFMENNDPLTADFILKLGGALLGELKKNKTKHQKQSLFLNGKSLKKASAFAFMSDFYSHLFKTASKGGW